MLRILIGLGKKLVLADTLALTGAELGYASRPSHAWTIVLAYTFRIYFDFSAYSDLAIGFSRPARDRDAGEFFVSCTGR